MGFILCESSWSACSKAPKMKFLLLNWLINKKWKVKGFLHILQTQALSLCNSLVYFFSLWLQVSSTMNFSTAHDQQWWQLQSLLGRTEWNLQLLHWHCLQHSLMWSQMFYNLKCYLKHFKCNTKMGNPQVLGGLGFFNQYGATFPIALLFFSFFKVQFAQRILEYEERCVLHCQSGGGHTLNMYLKTVLCIRLMYLNIKNFGYMPIVLSLEKCCGHKKEFHKK